MHKSMMRRYKHKWKVLVSVLLLSVSGYYYTNQQQHERNETLNESGESMRDQRSNDIMKEIYSSMNRREISSSETDDVTNRTDDVINRTDDFTNRTDSATSRIDDVIDRTFDVTSRIDSATSRIDDVIDRTFDVTSRIDDVTSKNDDVTNRISDVTHNNDDFTSRGDDMTDAAHKFNGTVASSHYCTKPVKHVYFLKVHKAGSTTIQNILWRYGFSHGLNIVTFHNKLMSLASPNFEHLLPPDPPSLQDGKYDIFLEHSIYDERQLKKRLFEDTVNIAIIRKPLSQLHSTFKFYKLSKVLHLGHFQNPMAEFLQRPEKYMSKTKQQSVADWHLVLKTTKNRVATEFGFHPGEHSIQGYLKYIESKFLVLILERLSESLVLLRRKLCWGMKDILVFQMRQQNSGHVNRGVTSRRYDDVTNRNDDVTNKNDDVSNRNDDVMSRSDDVTNKYDNNEMMATSSEANSTSRLNSVNQTVAVSHETNGTILGHANGPGKTMATSNETMQLNSISETIPNKINSTIPTLERLHKAFSPDDYTFYEYFTNVMLQTLDAQPDDFQQEVKLLEEMQEKTNHFCDDICIKLGHCNGRACMKLVIEDCIRFPESPWSDSFNIMGLDCLLLKLSPMIYRFAQKVRYFPQLCTENTSFWRSFVFNLNFCSDYFAYTFPWALLEGGTKKVPKNVFTSKCFQSKRYSEP